MAALVTGQQYGLSAQDKNNYTKSLIFVKLTDSALRSIEECVKNKGDSKSKPTIKFQNSNGVISIPHNGSLLTYGFNLSSVEADGPQGSFECLQQNGHRSLESLGCMHTRMHIHANEDSYENTRVKMAAVQKEQELSCTKVIKPTGSHLGRKVVNKVRRPGLVVSPLKSSPPTSSMMKPPSLHHHQPPLSTVPPPPPPSKPPKAKLPHVKNPELLKQPIRDRIIHILASRPYKKPELLLRLINDGIRDKDKNKVTAILPQLSTLKGNIYYLNNFLWNEVQDSWKFCSPEELEIIKKKKQQYLNSNGEAESPSNASPFQVEIKKRVASDAQLKDNSRGKKQRISHYKAEPQRVPQPGLAPPTTNPPSALQHHQQPDDETSNKSPSTTTYHPTNFLPRNPAAQNSRTREEGEKCIRSHTSGLVDKSPLGQQPESPPSGQPSSVSKAMGFTGSKEKAGGSRNTSPNSESSCDSGYSNDVGETYVDNGLQVPLPTTQSPATCDSPEYEKEYSRVVSMEQRTLYKEHFYREYKDYLSLHHKISAISNKFESLESNLKACKEGSDKYNKIRSKIYEEYRSCQRDANYSEAIKKFNFLHNKLAHIKRLVTEYDNSTLLQRVKS